MKNSPCPVAETAQGRIIRIGAGADDRAIAYPAWGLVGHPAGRGSRGEIAAVVPSDGTHSAVPVLLVGGFSTSAAAPFQLVLQFPPALFTVKIAWLGKDNALLPAKRQRTLSQ